MKNCSIQNVVLPYYKPEELEQENTLFTEAYLYHCGKDKQDIVKAVHGYHEAFMEGCLEAGVNMLHMICVGVIDTKGKNPEKSDALMEKFWQYVIDLEEADHPAGIYYEALAKILGLFGEDGEESCTEGIELMAGLIVEKLIFAHGIVEDDFEVEDNE